MRIIRHVLPVIALSAFGGLTMGGAVDAAPASIFAAPSPLPYHAPQFDKIKDSDYAPAFIEGMKRQRAEIDAIANSAQAPTFVNTIVALEKSGRMLDRVSTTFFNVQSANTNDTLDKIQTEMAPRLAAHSDAIFLDAKLFARIKALYDKRAGLKLDPEALQVLTLYYRQFVHAGANLAAKDQARLREINKQDATLETQFQQKLVA